MEYRQDVSQFSNWSNMRDDAFYSGLIIKGTENSITGGLYE